MPTKRKNPQDATLRNVRASVARMDRLTRQVHALTVRVQRLERAVKGTRAR